MSCSRYRVTCSHPFPPSQTVNPRLTFPSSDISCSTYRVTCSHSSPPSQTVNPHLTFPSSDISCSRYRVTCSHPFPCFQTGRSSPCLSLLGCEMVQVEVHQLLPPFPKPPLADRSSQIYPHLASPSRDMSCSRLSVTSYCPSNPFSSSR